MHKNVEILIGRLATDPKLRRRFAAHPPTLLAELSEQGFELTPVECVALAGTDPRALNALAESLDRRLCKSPPAAEPLTDAPRDKENHR